MPSNSAEAADVVALLKQVSLAEQAPAYELGCGWRSLVIALARAFPGAYSGYRNVGDPLLGSPPSDPQYAECAFTTR
jgi:hypothetical protein